MVCTQWPRRLTEVHTSTVTAHTHRTGLITARLFSVLEINEAGSQGRGRLADKLSGGYSR